MPSNKNVLHIQYDWGECGNFDFGDCDLQKCGAYRERLRMILNQSDDWVVRPDCSEDIGRDNFKSEGEAKREDAILQLLSATDCFNKTHEEVRQRLTDVINSNFNFLLEQLYTPREEEGCCAPKIRVSAKGS